MRLEDATPGRRVIYIPGHAGGDKHHPDCERGAVSSHNDKNIFVKFDAQVAKFGWQGTTSQACTPSDLQLIESKVEPVTQGHRQGLCKHPDTTGQQRRMMSDG